MPGDHDDDDPPVVRLVNMVLINAIKKKARAVRVRVDGPTEYWLGGAWAVEMEPPAKLRSPMIDRLKEMAEVPDDAPIRFNAMIRLMLGGAGGREQDITVAYARSEGGGVIVAELDEEVRKDDSDGDVMRKAWIMLQHAEDALARDEVRARIRDAVLRVKDQPGRRVFLISASRSCMSFGLYDDALELLSLARTLNADDPSVLTDIDAKTGAVLLETNRPKEAEESLRGALAIAERLPRPTCSEMYPLMQLATLAMDRGDLDGAEESLARIDAVTATFFGPPCAVGLLPCALRVRLLRERGDVAGADALAKRSLREIDEFGLAGEAEEVHAELAENALARGDASLAIEHLREVLQLPSRSPMRARVYASLARAQRAVGRDADAVSSLRAAMALVDGSLAVDHPVRLEVERELATLTATRPYR